MVDDPYATMDAETTAPRSGTATVGNQFVGLDHEGIVMLQRLDG
jgi:hypothetical protein